MKKTVVIGASPEPSRYSSLAINMLDHAGFEFVPVGIKEGIIQGKNILNLKEKPWIEDVHTITIYLRAKNQIEWYDYILGLQPKRIIFNPGAENPELYEMAMKDGIEVENACNLVLIQTKQF